jgi:hypothetical protein
MIKESAVRVLAVAAVLGSMLVAAPVLAQNMSGDGTAPPKEAEKIYAHPPKLAPKGVKLTKPNSNTALQGAQPPRGRGDQTYTPPPLE